MIGLSLSMCIKDLIDDTKAFDQADVEYIISGTMIKDLDALRDVIGIYCRSYWSKDPLRAAGIALSLWERGVILQPRVMKMPPPNLSQGWWRTGGYADEE